ncbi:uncharacterized protein LOC127109476 [Lathyrus oleraceus]|uniref:uncharacterized protein LOC127109476 n=1 Tax=Pisum sativum TaxID=3888 RepID=UPI0021CF22F7|nr:uncharacterized protein LOC127109476 [Pisum sativum]
MASTINNEIYQYSAKPPIFDGQKFICWKDRIKMFFLGYDADLSDKVMNGYTHVVDSNSLKLERDKIDEQQKKDNKNHHRSRIILLNVISYTKYEKITNRDSTKSIFHSLRITHEENEQVKKTNALSLIQKYEAFKMKEDETFDDIFSRFQTLVVGLKVLNKGYTTSYHVKKIIRSLPNKWRPMVTELKVSKDLNIITLKELVSFLRSHEIEQEEGESKRKGKFVALKSKDKPEKTKSLQAKEKESEEGSDEEDELQKRSRADKKVTYYECKELCHYKNECSKLNKEKPKNKFFREKKKVLMATCDDSDSSKDNYEEKQDNMALMASTEASKSESESELNSDTKEVFSHLTRSELELSLAEILENSRRL